ncbi:MAG: hypothetical protein SWQ30_23195, partial [Thermodesulfobacteriota bacterium]|nr:hypothetical protein [Thermodesulfobacteriota bacterium]
MRCFLLTCLTLSAFAVLGAVSNCSASGGARGADARTAEYWRAVSLINLGRRSRFERRDRAAWGEFARAYSILSDIRGMDPDFQKRSLALRLRACEVAIHHLEPSLPELDRRLSSTSEAVSESLSRAMTQNDEILRVIREIRDYLELLGEKEPEDAEEQEEMAG